MKNRIINNMIIFILLVLFLLTISKSIIVSASLLLLIVYLSYILLGYRSNKINYININVSRKMLLFSFIFISLIYLIGLLLGYNNNTNFLDKTFLFVIILLILIELLRYIVIWANKDIPLMLYLYTFLISIIEIIIYISIINTKNEFLYYLLAIVIPILVKNIVFSIICYYSGYKPILIYRVIIDCSLFIIPIVPNIDYFINSMITINVLFIILISSVKIISSKFNNPLPVFYNKKFTYLKGCIASITLIVIGLVSGVFPHMLIGIQSDSMNPTIYKGDAVIIDKVSNNNINKNDIIAYNDNGTLIIHRVIDIISSDNNTYYITKGDNNNTIDKKIDSSAIKGIVKLRIPLISWPSIWINELIGKG